MVVVGGGSAGLQAALMLGRARRTVTVVDGGRPRNAAASAVHNLLGHEGIAPDALLARGRADALRYGVEIVPGSVVDVRRHDPHWLVRTEDGARWHARALLLATGIVEDLPAIDGLASRWGRDVVACPYCHGWEARDKAVAVVGSGPRAWQHLLLLLRFTPDLALISNGPAGLDEARLEYLRRAGVVIRENPVARVEVDGDRLTAVRLVTGETLPREALFVVTARRQPSDLAARLGCPVLSEGPMAGAIDADATGRTSVPNVWAAGSSVNPGLTVIGAAGHASAVAIAINNALIDEDVAREIAGWNAGQDVVGRPMG
ncbi:NAD(P)/FAD-dependent oxidoreductase [Pseudonocardia sp. CA-142604]|uniref:NAD(P)/FAD-dependent oxidoreductase n=1 Tax=Pseudonocardia sp. CA-142604 TaxID=3240024 RepID=UPI003D943B7A